LEVVLLVEWTKKQLGWQYLQQWVF
jgi:hypothetical protein